MKNERTSKLLASLAGRILDELQGVYGNVYRTNTRASMFLPVCSVAELRSLCASCLTQAPSHPAKPAKRKRGKA